MSDLEFMTTYMLRKEEEQHSLFLERTGFNKGENYFFKDLKFRKERLAAIKNELIKRNE